MVTNRYKVIQNEEAFSFTDSLLGEGVRYETAGSLQRGKKVWLLARMPQDYIITGERISPYLVFSNIHDGSGAIKVALTPIRVVCNNTLTGRIHLTGTALSGSVWDGQGIHCSTDRRQWENMKPGRWMELSFHGRRSAGNLWTAKDCAKNSWRYLQSTVISVLIESFRSHKKKIRRKQALWQKERSGI